MMAPGTFFSDLGHTGVCRHCGRAAAAHDAGDFRCPPPAIPCAGCGLKDGVHLATCLAHRARLKPGRAFKEPDA